MWNEMCLRDLGMTNITADHVSWGNKRIKLFFSLGIVTLQGIVQEAMEAIATCKNVGRLLVLTKHFSAFAVAF